MLMGAAFVTRERSERKKAGKNKINFLGCDCIDHV